MNMKLGIIAEFHDRALKGMRKLMRVNSKLEKSAKAQKRLSRGQARSVDKAARSQKKLARASQQTGRAMRLQARAAQALKTSLNAASKAAAKLIIHQKKLNRKGVAHMRAGGGRLARGAVVAGGIAVGAGAAAAGAANMVIGPAAQMEQNQVILETTERSVKKAKAAMKWVTNFAVKTPYELNQVMESFVKLRAYGLDPTNGLLKTLGDTSAAMGKPLVQSVEAIADAVTGENERLKEFGITAKKTGKTITYEYTNAMGKTVHASVRAGNRLKIQQTLMKIWAEKYGGAMEKLSRSWLGMTSNLKDMWFKFRLMVADSGVFDFAKDKLRGFLDLLNEMEKSGQLQKLASEIGSKIIMALKAVWQFGTGVWAVFKQIGRGLSWAAHALGGWNRLAGVLVALPFAKTLMSAALGAFQIARGLALIAAGPLGLVIAGVALVAAIMVDDWGAVFTKMHGWWDGAAAGVTSFAKSFKAGFGSVDISTPLAFFEKLKTTWSKITAVGGKLVNIWNRIFGGTSVGKVSNFGEIVGKVFGKFVDLSFKPLEMAAIAIGVLFDALDKFLGLFTGKTSIDWTTLIPALPELPDLSSWKKYWADFVSLTWLPKMSWPEFTIPEMPKFNWPKMPKFKLPEGSQKAILAALVGPIEKGFKTVQVIWEKLKKLFDFDPIAAIKKRFGPIADTVTGFITTAADRAGAAYNRLKNIFSSDDPITIVARDPASIERATLAADKLKKTLTGVAGVNVSPAMAELNKLIAAARAMPKAVAVAIASTKSILNAVNFTHQGKRMMDTLAAGIRARAGAVVSEIQKVTQQVRNHLPSSPAKVGPLSDIHRLKFTETIARSIKPAPMVKAMRAAAFATMAAANPVAAIPVAISPSQSALSAAQASGSAGTVTVHYSPVIHIGAGASVSKDQIRQVLREHADELVRMIEQRQSEKARLKF
jgi:hypothetical protein